MGFGKCYAAVGVYFFNNCNVVAPTRNCAELRLIAVFIVAAVFVNEKPITCIAVSDKRLFTVHFVHSAVDISNAVRHTGSCLKIIIQLSAVIRNA